MTYTFSEVAASIFTDLNNPAEISTGLIKVWLQSHIGELNNLIATGYVLNSEDAEVKPLLGEEEKSIFTKMYTIYFYDLKLRRVLNAADSSSVLQISENGATIRVLNKNELAKTYVSIKKDEIEELNRLIHLYRMNNAQAVQIVGDDITEGWYNNEILKDRRNNE